jgi:hypothetical protein
MGTVWFDDVHPTYYSVLGEIGDPDTVAFLDATYDLESISHENRTGETALNQRIARAVDAIELPVEMSVGTHTIQLPFAEDIEGAQARGFAPRITLRMRLRQYTYPDEFDVSLNGELLDPNTRTSRAVFRCSSWTTTPGWNTRSRRSVCGPAATSCR